MGQSKKSGNITCNSIQQNSRKVQFYFRRKKREHSLGKYDTKMLTQSTSEKPHLFQENDRKTKDSVLKWKEGIRY
jgi:hypothetical protein